MTVDRHSEAKSRESEVRGGGDNKCLINKNAKRIGGEGELRGGKGELDSKRN